MLSDFFTLHFSNVMMHQQSGHYDVLVAVERRPNRHSNETSCDPLSNMAPGLLSSPKAATVLLVATAQPSRPEMRMGWRHEDPDLIAGRRWPKHTHTRPRRNSELRSGTGGTTRQAAHLTLTPFTRHRTRNHHHAITSPPPPPPLRVIQQGTWPGPNREFPVVAHHACTSFPHHLSVSPPWPQG